MQQKWFGPKQKDDKNGKTQKILSSSKTEKKSTFGNSSSDGYNRPPDGDALNQRLAQSSKPQTHEDQVKKMISKF